MTLPSNPAFRMGDLVKKFGGNFSGNSDQIITGFATLESATRRELAFLSNPKYKSQVGVSRAAAILIAPHDAAVLPEVLDQPEAALLSRLWVIDRPYLQFARIAQYLEQAGARPLAAGVHASAVVDATAQIDASAWVGAQAVIGAHAIIGARAVISAACVLGEGVEIGDDTRLHAHVTFYAHGRIGQRGIVHSGAVIGADGFGFAPDGANWVKIPQTGRVLIGDDVEIGANTTIDRGALEDTLIGNGVKLDNQIQIGHNVRIGDHTAIAGCVAIAGSAVIGQRCQIAGGVRIVGHISLADDVHVSATTLVTHSIHQAGVYSGAYPMDRHEDWQKNAAALKTLNKLRDRIRSIEQQLKDRS